MFLETKCIGISISFEGDANNVTTGKFRTDPIKNPEIFTTLEIFIFMNSCGISLRETCELILGAGHLQLRTV